MGVKKLSALEAFDDNMRDAHHLVLLADSLTNERSRAMRKERRHRVGEAWGVPVKQRGELDCLESADVYMTFKPGSRLGRATFSDHRPLLRQALVAGCAATETYLADKVMSRVSELTTSHDSATNRIKSLRMTVGDWLYIEQNYQRRRRGLHTQVVEAQVRRLASTSPTKVNELMGLIGVDNAAGRIDGQRGCSSGDTRAMLQRVTARRNKIVHTGDRQGRGRASLSIEEVTLELEGLESIVHAIERIIG